MLGFVICAVSPAVVIPLMIDLQDRKLGTDRKLPSLIIAATCLDNIIAITGHSLMIGVTFNDGKLRIKFKHRKKFKVFILGELWWTVVQCPIQILSGIVYGVVIGCFLNIIRSNHAVIYLKIFKVKKKILS
jgi:NhaP-type Na+/H+ or K+/H+ antiporter